MAFAMTGNLPSVCPFDFGALTSQQESSDSFFGHGFDRDLSYIDQKGCQW